MSANEQLQSAYEEWRRLARAEGDAIQKNDWPSVADCQSAMQRLQSRIIQCSEAARQERLQLGQDGVAKEKNLHALVSELIEIERRNNALLDSVRQASRSQLGQLNQAGHTLRQVQRSYAPARPSVWTSFS